MLAYIHQTCGKPAFLLTHMPLPSERASSNIVLQLNGQPIEHGSQRICGSCNAAMMEPFPHTKNIRTMI